MNGHPTVAIKPISVFVLKRILSTFILFAALACSSLAKAQDPSARADDFGKGIGPILQEYCYDCHGRKKTKGKVKLTDYGSWADLEKNPELIEKMIGVFWKFSVQIACRR